MYNVYVRTARVELQCTCIRFNNKIKETVFIKKSTEVGIFFKKIVEKEDLRPYQ